MVSLKKFIGVHFRIIALLLLSLVILLVFFSVKREPDQLPFGTYAFDIDGNGTIANASILFDFNGSRHSFESAIAPGTYSLQSNMPFVALVDGQLGCESDKDGSRNCPVTVSSPGRLNVVFDERDLVPNGRFRFSFLNKTDVNLAMRLGPRYEYINVFSVLPSQLHGHYMPEQKELDIQTVNFGSSDTDDERTDYVDFDLYAVNALARNDNNENDWRENIILVPLIITFLTLLLSEVIDYAHRYLQKKTGERK